MEEKHDNYYLTKEDLMKELMIYKEKDIVTKKFEKMLIDISTGIARKPNFSNYTWIDDMISEGIITCLKYGKNFDPEKSQNPFGYLSLIVYRSFQAYLNKQKKHKKTKDELYHYGNDISWNSAIDYSKFKNKTKKKSKIEKTEYIYICPKCGCVEHREISYTDDISYVEAIEIDKEKNECKFC